MSIHDRLASEQIHEMAFPSPHDSHHQNDTIGHTLASFEERMQLLVLLL